uniref:Uncharacterized protein n=1 Tax=Knipowitschia caucasica TaxID=637954 RepID=A0AAV2LCP5_KNICA
MELRSGPWLEACPWRVSLQRGQLTLQTIKKAALVPPGLLRLYPARLGEIAAVLCAAQDSLLTKSRAIWCITMARRWSGSIRLQPVDRRGDKAIIRTSSPYHLSHLL